MKENGMITQWEELADDYIVKVFLKKVNFFHDSCIKEMKYYSGSFVDDDLSMYPINDTRRLHVVFQMQSKDYSMIEMEFSGLKQFMLCPTDEGNTSEILGATMIIDKGEVCWCDSVGLDSDDIAMYNGTVIRAERCRWRGINGFMGAKEFYNTECDS